MNGEAEHTSNGAAPATNGSETTGANNPSSQTQPIPANPPPPPQSPRDLPPEALDLATKLFDYARHGETQALSSYLTAGIPVNLTNATGNTLLMLAAYHNHVQTCSLLLTKGADANAVNDRGQTPLAGAVFKGYGEVVTVLMDEGRADCGRGTPSALETAGMFRRFECARLMGVEGEVRERVERGELDPVGGREVGRMYMQERAGSEGGGAAGAGGGG